MAAWSTHSKYIAEVDKHVTRSFSPAHNVQASGHDIVCPSSANKVGIESEGIPPLGLVAEAVRQPQGIDCALYLASSCEDFSQ